MNVRNAAEPTPMAPPVNPDSNPRGGGRANKLRQDAMTSAKVMLTVGWLVLLTGLTGCGIFEKPVDPLVAPYPSRHVWAIAPLKNESGSLQADGLTIADHFQRQLGSGHTQNLDVLPVNRTLQAMQSLGLSSIDNPAQALKLLRTLGCDGLVVGTITAYDPYDPPKLGLGIELYINERLDQLEALQLRKLTVAASEAAPNLTPQRPVRNPASIVTGVFNAADPATRDLLVQYGTHRGPQKEPEAWRRYRISMDLYTEFVAYTLSWRLLDAERQRLEPPATQPDSW